MASLPRGVPSVFSEWSAEFSATVWPRFRVLVFAAFVCVGRHTICRLLRVAGALADGHRSSDHRVLSQRRWSSWKLARIPAQHVVDRLVPQGPIPLSGDDNVTRHPGKKVSGKGRHRDAVRSTHSCTAWRWGHKWVVPGNPGAVAGMEPAVGPADLVALDRSPEEDQRLGRRHKTPCDLRRQLLCVLLRWFPQRKFVLAGDGGSGTHALARFVTRQPRLTLVSTFHKDANLDDSPPKRMPGTNGRPRVEGRKRPSPEMTVAKTRRRQRLQLSWSGGQSRHVGVVTGTGSWSKAGQGLVSVRWVFVEDLTGTHRDESFFTTDIDLTPKQVTEACTGRWAIEVMFEEMREHLGRESTRGRCTQTILRAEPCLFGLDTLMALWFSELPEKERQTPAVAWTGRVKQSLTFSDAITLVRRRIGRVWILQSPRHATAFQKLTRKETYTLLELVTQAL